MQTATVTRFVGDPTDPGKQRPNPEIEHAVARTRAPGRYVLLVEDNPGDAALVGRMLASRGVHLDVVTDLASSRERLAMMRYDAVLLDLGLPDGRDLATVRRIVPAAPSTPVVVLTGREDDGLAEQCIEHGADDYVLKADATPHVLARAIEHAITRRKAAEFGRRLEVAERHAALGRIAASVAHEVNNQAGVLLANNELIAEQLRTLASTATGPAAHPALDTITRTVADDRLTIAQIADIVRELTGFVREDDAPPQAVDAAAVIRRTLRMMGHRLGASVAPTVELAACPPVLAHESKLVQVLINLLKNAVEAIEAADRAQPILRVRLTSTDDHVEIRIADNGVGISTEARQRLFTPYFTSKPRGRGTGLGLAVCAELVHAWGGVIDVDSEPGVGSTFTIRLQVAPDRIPDLPSASHSPPDPDVLPPPERTDTPPRRRVLIVDDEAALAKPLARILARHHDAVPVIGGRAALDLLAHDTAFDALLIDLMMPDIDGVTLCQHLERHHPDLYRRTAILSGGAFTDRATNFLKTAGRPVLAKPVVSAQVRELIEVLANDD